MSPLEQFKLVPYIRIYNNYYDISLTNTTVYILISGIIGMYIMNSRNRIISNRIERIGEMMYMKVEEIIRDMIGKTKYIPMIISIFLFILISNLIGLIPYSFTTTSHIIITLLISMGVVIGITIIGIGKHKGEFINLFIPSGLNQGFTKYIIPLIFLIEIISYLSRIVSLSVRLTANMISGHLLLHIVTNFGLHLSIFLYFLPILLLFPLFILELGVAIIQSYVITVLIVSYIKDVEYLH